MIVSVHQPQYIPWLGYFDKIAKSDSFVFLDRVQYKAREYQNRNKIRTKDGCMWLTVPVISKDKGRQAISEVLIDNEMPWKRQHLNSLKIWYSNSPHFKECFPFFEELYGRHWDRLANLNVYIIEYLLKELSIKTKVYFESALKISGTKTDRIIQICKKLNADTYLSGAGGRDYLDENKFKEEGIELRYQEFVHPEYHQRFNSTEEDFLPFMSTLDLLFNEGPNSLGILGIHQ
jgi:hypothetical protein